MIKKLQRFGICAGKDLWKRIHRMRASELKQPGERTVHGTPCSALWVQASVLYKGLQLLLMLAVLQSRRAKICA